MPQSLAFSWSVVLPAATPVAVGAVGLITRPGVRLVPVGKPIRVRTREDDRTLGRGRFDHIHVASARDLLALYGDDLPDDERQVLLDGGDDVATVLRYVVDEIPS